MSSSFLFLAFLGAGSLLWQHLVAGSQRSAWSCTFRAGVALRSEFALWPVGELSAWVQPPMTQSCSESALTGLGLLKAPARPAHKPWSPCCGSAVEGGPEGMFVAGGPARAGSRLLGRMSGITAKSASVAAFHHQEQGVCGPAPRGRASGTKSRGHTRGSCVSPPASAFTACPYCCPMGS